MMLTEGIWGASSLAYPVIDTEMCLKSIKAPGRPAAVIFPNRDGCRSRLPRIMQFPAHSFSNIMYQLLRAKWVTYYQLPLLARPNLSRSTGGVDQRV